MAANVAAIRIAPITQNVATPKPATQVRAAYAPAKAVREADSKRDCSLRSSPNALITRMPERLSWICEVSALLVARACRKRPRMPHARARARRAPAAASRPTSASAQRGANAASAVTSTAKRSSENAGVSRNACTTCVTIALSW